MDPNPVQKSKKGKSSEQATDDILRAESILLRGDVESAVAHYNMTQRSRLYRIGTKLRDVARRYWHALAQYFVRQEGNLVDRYLEMLKTSGRQQQYSEMKIIQSYLGNDAVLAIMVNDPTQATNLRSIGMSTVTAIRASNIAAENAQHVFIKAATEAWTADFATFLAVITTLKPEAVRVAAGKMLKDPRAQVRLRAAIALEYLEYGQNCDAFRAVKSAMGMP